MIDRNNPIPDIRKVFSKLLGINPELRADQRDGIPLALSELWEIKEEYDAVKPVNSLFNNQDYLKLRDEIGSDDHFTFLLENQSCWSCQTERGLPDPPVYIDDPEIFGLTERQKIHDSLKGFLTTYALMELTFELGCDDYYSYNNNFAVEDILGSNLKAEPIWADTYAWLDNQYRFWIVEDVCLLMDCSITFIGTKDKEKFNLVNGVIRP